MGGVEVDRGSIGTAKGKMKKADLPQEVINIEKNIRRFGAYAKLSYHQWRYASLQLYKNRKIGFRTMNYLAEDPDNGRLIHMRFGWNEHFGLYAAVTCSGHINYYGRYIDEKEIQKYQDKKIIVSIPDKLKTAYATVLTEKNRTMQDDIMEHITSCVGGNLGAEALEEAVGKPLYTRKLKHLPGD